MVAGSNDGDTETEENIGLILRDTFSVADIFSINDHKVAVMVLFDSEEIFADEFIS